MSRRSYSRIIGAVLALSLVAGPAAAQQKPDESAAPASEANSDAKEAPKDDGAGSDQTQSDQTQPDRASVNKRYKKLTREAAMAYRGKDYDRALELFDKAYQLKAVPNLLYNMGRIEEKRGNFDAAIAQYEKFVTEPDVDIKARKDALDRLETLREVVRLREKGQDVEKAEVDQKTSDRELADAQQAGPSTRIERDYTAAWVSLGVALAAYGTSGFFALEARNAHSDFEDATSRAARRDAASWGETSSIVADSTLALGVVMTGMATYFFLSPSEHEVPVEQTALRVSPHLGAHSAGMSFSLDF